jgi:hypothetical protein
MQTVHLRVNDAATGQPTPCRIRLTNAAGEYFAPFGRLTEFATGRNQDVGGNLLLGRKAYAYIDGTCEVALPPGPIHVEIHKGPEYAPQQLEMPLGPGKMALRVGVERWIDLRKDGWYSGDTRTHFLTPHAALLEAAAEDVAVVNLLATECSLPTPAGTCVTAIPNILAFSGQHLALETPGHMVVVNTLNSHPFLGSLGLLNCHRVVYPLSFGGRTGDNWSLADWCDQCHRKGGLVVWTNPSHETEAFRFGEPLADLILGKVDAFELDFFEDSPFDPLADWYALLNCGLRVPLAGGSGKEGNAVALGAMRTYARVPAGEPLTYKGWIEAVRAGRTFVTNGPLLFLDVAGHGPGDRIDLESAGQTVHVRAEARSAMAFDQLELIVNGQVVGSTSASGSPCSAVIEQEVPVDTSGWLAARCRGQGVCEGLEEQRVFAHTSPIYLRVGGRPMVADPSVAPVFLRELEALTVWAEQSPWCKTDHQRDQLVGIFKSAHAELQRRLTI